MGRSRSTTPVRSGRVAARTEPAIVERAIAEIRAGHVVVVAFPDRWGGEGVVAFLVAAGQTITPATIRFLLRYGTGAIYVPSTFPWLQRLRIHTTVSDEGPEQWLMATVTVRGAAGSGATATDRAKTIQLIADPSADPLDLVRPGATLPLVAREGGVLVRPRVAEAAVDLCVLAGMPPVAVDTALTDPERGFADLARIRSFARRHRLALIAIDELVGYRLTREQVVGRVASAALPTLHGDFVVHGYHASAGGAQTEHVALTMGELRERKTAPLVRIHRECVAGDTFGAPCRCRDLLEASLRRIAAEGRGAFVYMRRGPGQERTNNAGKLLGRAHLPRDQRHLGPMTETERHIAGAILRDLGVGSARMLTPERDPRLTSSEAVEVVGRVQPLSGAKTAWPRRSR